MVEPPKPRRTPPIRLLVVIVNYKTAALTIACLRSLETEIAAASWTHVVVVDNQSGDKDAINAAIQDHKWGSWASLLVAEKNGGFAYGSNQGIAPALQWPEPPDYFLLLNPDTEVRRGAIQSLVEYMDLHPKVGIGGSSFENEDGSDWPIAFRFPTVWSEFEQGIRLGPISRLLQNKIVARIMAREPAQVDWVSGASMIIRRQVIEDIGLLDEGYFLYFDEVDYCMRAAKAGWPCWYIPASRVMHIGGASTGVTSSTNKLKRMPKYWFNSRTRFFVKNYGLTYACFADLAFGIGRTLSTVRQWFSKQPSRDPPGMLSDFWKTSVLFKSRSTINKQLIDNS